MQIIKVEQLLKVLKNFEKNDELNLEDLQSILEDFGEKWDIVNGTWQKVED